MGAATSAAARILANKENLADLVGGSPNGEASEASDPIILNMCQTNTLNVSKNFGTVLLDSLDRVGHVKFRTVQEAPLRVLKLPEIPSVLVETAYISNPEEEEWLKDPAFQSRMAEAIGKTVCEFSPSAPLAPSGSPAILTHKERNPEMGRKTRFSAESLAGKTSSGKAKEADTQVVTFHKVKKGETLQKIALKYHVSLDDLAQLNGIKKQAPLPAGKRLKIAKLSDLETAEIDRKSTKEDRNSRRGTKKELIAVSLHKVRKGETLDIIARHYHTSIAALRKLNGMTSDDPLYAGVTIKVNGEAKDDSVASDDNGIKTRKDARNRKASPPSPIVFYEVKKGDSFDSIARKHDMTVAELLKLNSMKRRYPLLAGKKIRIAEAASGAESKEEKSLSSSEGTGSKKKKVEVITYKVKRGDTLDTIARKYKTRVDVLLSLNKMKSTDPLYANQPLKLPRGSSI
jgi:N-acetylmuramoyl-L-alanine amidase